MVRKEEANDVDVNLKVIVISILLAVVHGLIEAIFIVMEKVANKTSTMNYLMICFNGRFGFIPFVECLDKKKNLSEKSDVLDYD